MRPLLATLLFALQPVVASAGVVIEVSVKDPSAKAPSTTTLQAAPDRFRLEGAGQIVIYRADKDLAWIIDPETKTYSELNRQVMNKAAGAMKEVDAAMAEMTPEQRAMVQGMMAGHGMPQAAQAPPAIHYKDTARSDVVHGFPCSVRETLQGEKHLGEVCVTPWAATKIAESDMSVMERFADFVKQLSGPLAKMASDNAVPDIAELHGLPVRTVMAGPEGDVVHEIVRIDEQDVPASAFELPSGLKREDLGAP
jgi:hypothetical protein